MIKEIYIVCGYKGHSTERDLHVFPSGMTYVEYIKGVIKSLNYKVHILSLSESNTRAYLNWETNYIDEKEEHHYLATLKRSKKGVGFAVNLLFRMIQLILWLLRNTKREDIIIVYHNNSWSYFYGIIEYLTRRKICLLVAEVFGAVYNRGEKNIEKELGRIGCRRKSVFINDILPKIVKPKNKFCICYGSYRPFERKENSSFGDDKIHIVYAGKIDYKDVTDAFMAAETARHLDNHYYVHILGYGRDCDIKRMKERIEQINMEKGVEIIKYEGCLSGEEYDGFLQKCKIGLCTRVLSQELSDYCFPSKTLVYLAHNLIPVCPGLRSFQESRIAKGLILVEGEFTPKAVAATIMRIPGEMLERDYRQLLEEMDRDFKNDMMDLLEY